MTTTHDHAATAGIEWGDDMVEVNKLTTRSPIPAAGMAHCHIAEHHESGMMLSFDVADAEGTS